MAYISEKLHECGVDVGNRSYVLYDETLKHGTHSPFQTQRIMAARGRSISMDALAGYVEWVSHNHDIELAKGNYLPDIAYDEDSKMFSFM